ncbi:MAG: helix-turn-helix domain-containing protein [Anaerosomatales bacterium]|nr:helix-turn-helix domain-containing protein [Anaerosomatales bacterium]
MPATKDEIATEFRAQVLRYGYRRAAVEDVARSLRISKKTIYDFFRSKEDLYRYAIELWATEQRRAVESMLTETTALGRIEQATAIAFAEARRGFEANPFQDATEPPEIVDEVNARVFGPMIRDLLAQGVESGEFSIPDVDMTTAFAVAIGTEAVRMLGDDPAGHAEEAALDAIRRLVGGTAAKEMKEDA